MSPVLGRRQLRHHLERSHVLPPVHVLMDESGNGNPDKPLIVGGLAADRDFEQLERDVTTLFEHYCAKERRFGGMSSFEDFKRVGFHGGQMPPEFQCSLVEFLAQRLDFKVFMTFSDGTRLPKATEVQRTVLLYSNLLTDLIVRYRRHAEVHVLVEENDQLRPFLGQVLEQANRRATAKSSLPIRARMDIRMIPKQEKTTLGVIDFYMHVTSKWLQAGAVVDRDKFQYRNFAALEPSVSFLWSLENGLVSNRSARVSS